MIPERPSAADSTESVGGPTPAEHPCARCARAQKTCCQRAEILLTTGDQARIAAHVGRQDFFEYRRPLDPEYLEDDPEDPDWKSWTVRADGSRRMLKRQPDGDCTFLGAAGCVLPLEVRPLVCRLYPFEYTAQGFLGEDPDYCPTALLAPRGQPMTEVLGMDEASARRWHGQLYRELEDGHP